MTSPASTAQKDRLLAAFDLSRPDRPPILGGVMAAPNHIQTLTGCSDENYWSDPFYWGLEAERVLGSDGVITILVPVSRDEYRCIDSGTLERRAAFTLDGVLDYIAALPEPAALEAQFDAEAAYQRFVDEYRDYQRRCGDILWCPADWDIIPRGLWYQEFGYENALLALAMYPERYCKLIQTSAVKARQRATLLARAIREGIYPRGIMTGEDLCFQRGSLVSPEFLRREYFPLVEYAIEPLLAVGAKLVWHCDGDYRPIIDDVLACGIAGLQGFQSECGMELDWIVKRRTRIGDPLLIFGAMSVTTTLPFGTEDDVRREVQRTIDMCRDNAMLVFTTSNDITPDIPLQNIRAFWQAVTTSRW
ncbi:MAG: hypothetical protein IT324_02965 [Anaerolineae bacterium]|nr:hypothetical protein [Anaerolineae bacterium]